MFSLVFFFFLCHFLGALSIFLGQAWAEGKGKLATSRQRANSGGETVKNVRRHSLDRLHASMNKQKKKSLVPKFCEDGFKLWKSGFEYARLQQSVCYSFFGTV